MENKNIIKKTLKNAEGKRLLEKTILNYSFEIIKEIKNNPQIFNNILNELEVTDEEFMKYISGEEKNNISFYDQTLKLIKEKKIKKEKK